MKLQINPLLVVVPFVLGLVGCASKPEPKYITTYREIPHYIDQPETPYPTSAICYVPTLVNTSQYVDALRANLQAAGFTPYTLEDAQKIPFKKPDFCVEIVRTNTFSEPYQKGCALYGKVFVAVRRPQHIDGGIAKFQLGEDARTFQAISRTLLPNTTITANHRRDAILAALKNLMGNPAFRTALDPTLEPIIRSSAEQSPELEAQAAVSPFSEDELIERLCKGIWTTHYEMRISSTSKVYAPNPTCAASEEWQFYPDGNMKSTITVANAPNGPTTFDQSYSLNGSVLTYTSKDSKVVYQLVWKDKNAFALYQIDMYHTNPTSTATFSIKNGECITTVPLIDGNVTTVVTPVRTFTCSVQIDAEPTPVATTPDPEPLAATPTPQVTPPSVAPQAPAAPVQDDVTSRLCATQWRANFTIASHPQMAQGAKETKLSFIDLFTFAPDGSGTLLRLDQSTGQRSTTTFTYTCADNLLTLTADGSATSYRMIWAGDATFTLEATDLVAFLKTFPSLNTVGEPSINPNQGGIVVTTTDAQNQCFTTLIAPRLFKPFTRKQGGQK